jgi:hypothetical protein
MAVPQVQDNLGTEAEMLWRFMGTNETKKLLAFIWRE